MQGRNLVRAHGQPEPKAELATVAREYTLTLVARATALTKSSSDAWDLVQGVFERAARTRPPWFDRSDALGWLSVVMRNLFRDGYRARQVRRHVTLTDALANTLPQAEPEETPLWKRVSVEDLHRLAPRLSPMVRPAFVCSLKGMSAAEISSKLRITIPVVAARLFRGRQQLRRLLLDELEGAPVSPEPLRRQRTSGRRSRIRSRAGNQRRPKLRPPASATRRRG